MSQVSAVIRDYGQPSVSTQHLVSRRTVGRPILTRPELPTGGVLLAFPALLLLAALLLIGLGLNGSSSGAMRDLVTNSDDPDLLAGNPEQIRTDEWNVQTVWAISQVQQGLPVTNETFPGGMDATIPQDLPRADWSVAFRPHLLGFNILDLDRAAAWKWWVPGLALMAAAYAFAITVMPRRPIVAAMLSVGFFFTPLFQWWYLQTTLWPVGWGFATITAALWSMRSQWRVGSWIWGVVVAYLTVVMAMGIYVPYILPIVVVVALFVLALIVGELRAGRRPNDVIGRLLPLVTAGMVGAAVTGVWLYSKRATVEDFLSTAYPGERLTPTGASDALTFVSSVSSSFTQALKAGGLFGQNPSEASTAFFIGAFLIPVVVWIVVRQRRQRLPQPWLLLGLTAGIAVILGFLFVPGWDALAHLFFLDRMTGNRARIGVAFASIAMVPLLIAHFDRTPNRPGRVLAVVIAGLFLLSQVAIAAVLLSNTPDLVTFASRWWIFALLGAAALYGIARARPVVGVSAFLVVTVLGSYNVNPIYRGVYDLRETPAGRAVLAIDKAKDFAWVGIGDRLTTAVLVETGVRAYNGFQGAPSDEMWEQIDPSRQFEFEWNRLAGVSWMAADGDPVVANPYPDQITVTFDGCAAFAQKNVDYVLTQARSLDPCLTEVKSFSVADGGLWIYEVISR